MPLRNLETKIESLSGFKEFQIIGTKTDFLKRIREIILRKTLKSIHHVLIGSYIYL